MLYEFDGLEWDEKKRLSTLADRNLDFADAWQVLTDNLQITFQSPQKGEERFKTIGLLNSSLIVVIHTPRGRNCRIISLRRAHQNEEEAYYGNC
jgi:uncharacterized DUF497 family protein